MDYGLINRAMAVQPFFYLGFLFKNREESLVLSSNPATIYTLAFIFIILVLMGFVLYPGESIDIHVSRYYSYWLNGLQIILGLLFMTLLFKKIDKYPKWLLEIGKSTLVIYIWHDYVIFAFRTLMAKTGIEIPLLIMAVVSSMVGVLVCCVLNRVVSKYAPFMVGNR